MSSVLAATDFSPDAITSLFLALGIVLALARFMGELARKFRQPAVLGEIAAGILLGPTLLGVISPDIQLWLFADPAAVPHTANYMVLEFLFMLSAALLLLVAGIEVDLGMALRQGKAAAAVALLGMLIPFGLGFGAAWMMPSTLGIGPDFVQDKLPFALFVGIAVSITALPVIASVLMDLKMLKSDIGMLIMSAAMLNDLLGWFVFAVLLAMIGGGDHAAVTEVANAATEVAATASEASGGGGAAGVLMSIGLTIAFLAVMLTIGRVAFDRMMPFLQAHTTWPGSVISLVLVLALVCAAFTEYIGIHSIFGAFIAGVAIGDSNRLRESTRHTIHQFITNIFAPLFFAGIGLRVNFFESFDFTIVVLVLVVAVIGKFSGSFLGARISGLRGRTSAAISSGMLAQGAMGIILGQLARQVGLISEELFVGIVVMAMITSLVAGPMMQRILQQPVVRTFAEILSDKQFVARLSGRSAKQVIGELAQTAAELCKLDAKEIEAAVLAREDLMSTGLGDELAIPHARLPGLTKPVVVLGRSEIGVDFNARDGKPAHLICMLLTPVEDQAAQVELLQMFATAFCEPKRRNEALAAESYTELLASLKIGEEH
jgi:Kef-type K+ transport system membrane component KefB/mannitol/fructose-specific phosphotransferase system IIA component (Ntr-type)